MAGGEWFTRVPPIATASSNPNAFLGGLAFQVPAGGFPGGINPVTWSGDFSATGSKTIQWQWAAAVYPSTFGVGAPPTDTYYNSLGVKPIDGNQYNPYANSDHAGTPENFKTTVVGGARGGGGSNFTGSYSATKSVVLCVNT